MNHADFEIVHVENDRVFIIDLNLGHKSITNDAEWVYVQINSLYPNHRLIYRDSMNNWDEITPATEGNGNAITVNFKPYHEHIPYHA